MNTPALLPKFETLQVNESVANIKLREQMTSRCLRSVPSEKEKNEFFVGVNTSKSSQIILTSFDEKVNKILTPACINLEEKIIDIYPSLNDKNLLFTQTFCTTSNSYYINLVKNDFTDGKLIHNERILNQDISGSIYEGKINPNYPELFYIINNKELLVYDIEKGQTSNKLKFNSILETNPVKISCDITPEYVSQYFARGSGRILTIYDLKNNEEITHLDKAHYNGILSVEFVPHTFTICTSGMDSAIKYWDTRNLKEPVHSITNNSHWIWSTKHNKVYNKFLITCSSNTLIKCYVFKNCNESNGFDFKPIGLVSEIDYNEFDDSVYSIDWANNDPWTFAGIVNNTFMHVNVLPDSFRIQALLDK